MMAGLDAGNVSGLLFFCCLETGVFYRLSLDDERCQKMEEEEKGKFLKEERKVSGWKGHTQRAHLNTCSFGAGILRAIRHRLWDSLLISFSMYSRIPVPLAEWSKEGMRHALCFFPMVGVVIGMAAAGFVCLSHSLGWGKLAFGCVGTVLPVLLTGGIHMDGFLDVVDARSSCQPVERKLEILKDPHTGAFAIVYGMVYMLLYLAVFSELGEKAFPAASGVYVLERAMSGWSVVSFPKAKRDGLASTFAGEASKRTVQIWLAVWALAASLFLVWMAGALAGGMAVAAACLVFGWYYRMSIKEFGGITGDLAGYFLQVCELVMLAVLAVML